MVHACEKDSTDVADSNIDEALAIAKFFLFSFSPRHEKGPFLQQQRQISLSLSYVDKKVNFLILHQSLFRLLKQYSSCFSSHLLHVRDLSMTHSSCFWKPAFVRWLIKSMIHAEKVFSLGFTFTKKGKRGERKWVIAAIEALPDVIYSR
jgi:hypothetical protein